MISVTRGCFVFLISFLRFGNADIYGVRLRGGPTPGQGRVEVKKGEQWGGVCDDVWTIKEANVVCKQLGYSHATKELKKSPFGEARVPIWIKKVTCEGAESELSSCSYQEMLTIRKSKYEDADQSICSYEHQAGVVCAEPSNPDADLISIRKPISSSGPSGQDSSLVTVKVNGQWMPICADNWSSKEGIVACRQAGLGFAHLVEKINANSPELAESYSQALRFVKCSGDEASLQQCEIPVEMGSCQNYSSVICSDESPDISVSIPMLERSIKIGNMAENGLLCAKEEMCLSHSGLSKSLEELKDSGLYRHLLKFTSMVQNYGTADFRPPQGGWRLHKCHRHYHSITDFARYELLDASRNIVEVGHKVSFCLRDSKCDSTFLAKYRCSPSSKDGNQGISVGCADYYAESLDCQWIDVTDVKDGDYLLKIDLNPNRLVPEQDYSNNLIICNVRIEGTFAKGSDCHHPADFEEYIPVNTT